MAASLGRQAERLFRSFVELVRRYQFRDREGICCHGLSVSQCYALESLFTSDSMTMGELAGELHLEISSMTRVVDFLVNSKLATRVQDANDRRVCRVRITKKGQSLITLVRGELIKEHEHVLRQVPSESREAVIQAVEHLLAAFKERQRCCATQEDEK